MKQLFTLPLILFLFSCSDDVERPNCGCDAETTIAINETEPILGSMFYLSEAIQDSFYINKFWINYEEPNCSNCLWTMVVCNEDILSEELKQLLQNNESKNVQFSGHLKPTCEKIFAPADYFYYRINLTNIEIL